MAAIVPVSEFVHDHGGLSVCTGSGEPVRVLMWQPAGEVALSTNNGPYIDDDLFLSKARALVELARVEHVDLLLTPEYAFPLSVLSTIISSTDMWPENGALWAFGMQGMNKAEMIPLFEQWRQSGSVIVIDSAYHALNNAAFVSGLIYVFRGNRDTLYVLPQFKTHSMADGWNEYEAPYLSTGEMIFEFDLAGKSASSNGFVSIICSDVHRITSQFLLDNTSGRNLTVFHPQLNAKPRHRIFRMFREGLFEYEHSRQVRLLTLNWAAGTKVGPHSFDVPWSSFYIKSYDTSVNRDLMKMNHNKGTYFAQNNKTSIWFGHREEHCRLVEIRKGDSGGVSGVAAHRQEPLVKGYFVFNERIKTWESKTLNIQHDLINLIGQHGDKYDFPLSASVDECDLYFGTCFGHSPVGEIFTNELELSSRLLVGSDLESDVQRKKKARLYRDLLEQLKQNKFPQVFSFLGDKHVLKVDSYFYDKEIACNLWEEGETHPLLGYTAVITDELEYGDVEAIAHKVMGKLHPNYRERLMVFYRSIDEDGYKCLGGTDIAERRISSGARARNLGSFRG